MTSLDFMLLLWDWFMLLIGYAIILLIAGIGIALIVDAFCKLLRAICYTFVGRYDDIGA